MSAPTLKTRTWQKLRRWVIDHSDGICGICGRDVDKTLNGRHPWGPTVDHRVPRARGGTDDLDNLVIAHLRCNAAKKDRLRARRRVNSQNW